MKNDGNMKVFQKVSGSGVDKCKGIDFNLNKQFLSIVIETTSNEFRPN